MVIVYGNLRVAWLGLPLRALQVAINLFRGFFAVGHGADDQAGAEGDVARGEHARRGCLECGRINLHCSLPRRFQSVLRFQKRKVRGLTDCKDRRINIENAFGAGFENGIEAVLSIEYRCALNGLQPSQLSIPAHEIPEVHAKGESSGLRRALP